MQPRVTTHYVANIGCTHFIDHADVRSGLREMCLAATSTGEHALPLHGYRLAVVAVRFASGLLEGAHVVLLRWSRWVATFTMAMRDETAAPLWRQFASHYLHETDHGQLAFAKWPLLKRPKITPWVASFPLQCTLFESRLLPEIVAAWATAFSAKASNEITCRA
jgi:hypothetical protein